MANKDRTTESGFERLVADTLAQDTSQAAYERERDAARATILAQATEQGTQPGLFAQLFHGHYMRLASVAIALVLVVGMGFYFVAGPTPVVGPTTIDTITQQELLQLLDTAMSDLDSDVVQLDGDLDGFQVPADEYDAIF